MAYNILIVDDSMVMREMVKKTVNLSGIPVGEVFEAANGQEGLAMLDAHWIDLALVDIHMPVMNGEQMLKKIRENEEIKDLAVVIVSSETNSSRIDLMVQQGAEFVAKPFSPENLSEVVTSLLGDADETE